MIRDIVELAIIENREERHAAFMYYYMYECDLEMTWYFLEKEIDREWKFLCKTK